MRTTLFVAAIAGVAAVAPPDALRSACATLASALFEATPFLFAGVALAALFRHRDVVAYAGCGCGAGPAARSLPATAIAWLAFGPAVALTRFVAAVVVAHVLTVVRRAKTCDAHDAPALLDELAGILPAAAIAAVATLAGVPAFVERLPAPEQTLAGALLGFVTAPCGIGAIAVAGALHARAPLATLGFLCTAGILDVRALANRGRHRRPTHDALAYGLLAAALAVAGVRHGAALVHPIIAGALLACAAGSLLLASLHRTRQSITSRRAPALMLAAALVAAPPPAYRATETTMTDLVAGERLSFVGALTRAGGNSALVRYAITCCRADAAPIVVRLERPPPFHDGTWLRADGIVTVRAGEARLDVRTIEPIAPPADPFLYR